MHSASRELLEECCVNAEDLQLAGRIEFEFQGDPCILDVHVFTVEKFTGDPKETEGKSLFSILLLLSYIPGGRQEFVHVRERFGRWASTSKSPRS